MEEPRGLTNDEVSGTAGRDVGDFGDYGLPASDLRTYTKVRRLEKQSARMTHRGSTGRPAWMR